MKRLFFMVALCAVATLTLAEEKSGPKRSVNTVILTETGVKNLRIETEEAEETDFEEIVFALGHIDAIPNKIAAVSSRISGRITELKVSAGDEVREGDVVARLESRQAGDPPPSILLKAPIAGLVTKIDARLGDPLEPDRALLEITDLTEVYAVARVPEHQAGRMQPGAVAHIKIAALPNEAFDGELLRFGTAADEQSGTLDAIFRLPNKGGRIRAGMRAEFSIVISKREGVVTVPRAALQGEASGRFVYVEDFDLKNAFVKTPVEVGQMNDRFVEIASGLLPGDKVVKQGAYSLAFAGGGSISLKAALDAAHGHEHAEDGSELTPAARAKMAKAASQGHEGGEVERAGPFWKIVSGVLFVLLMCALFFKQRTPTSTHPMNRGKTEEAP